MEIVTESATKAHPVDLLNVGDRITDSENAGAVVMVEGGQIAIAWDDMDEPAVYPIEWFRNFWNKHGFEVER